MSEQVRQGGCAGVSAVIAQMVNELLKNHHRSISPDLLHACNLLRVNALQLRDLFLVAPLDLAHVALQRRIDDTQVG